MSEAAVSSPAGAPGEPERLPSRRIHPLRSVLAHKYLALGAAALVTCVMGPPVVYMKGKHYFYTEAALYISPRFAKNLEQDPELEMQSNSQYREFVQQQVRTINRFDIVAEALGKLGAHRYAWQRRGEPDRVAAERLQGQLQIRPVPDTYQVTVGLEATSPDGLAEVVNSVLATYMEKFKEEELFGSRRRIQDLESERRSLEQQIEAKTARRTELAQELGVTTFNDSNPNPYDQLLAKAKEALAGARRARFEAAAQLGALDGGQRGGGAAALRGLAQDLALRDPGLTSLKANLNQRRADLLTRSSGLTAEHPGRQAIDEELKEIDAELQRVNAGLVGSFSAMLLEQRQADVYRAERLERDLNGETAELARQAAWFAAGFQEAMECGRDLERLRKRLNAVDDRVDFLSLENRAPGFVRIFSPARPPLAPSKSAHKMFALLFAVAGLCVGVALPVAVDLIDPRIHTPNDVHNLLGFAPVGWIPEREAASEPLERDQRLRLAGSLARESARRGTRTVLLTGVKPGAGVTTLALALAEEMNRLGIAAAAIDINGLHPDARYAGGEPRPAGLAGMPERLAELARRYAVVLLDAAPLLLSGETEHLTALADVTLLVVEAEAVTRAEVKRAARLLERLAPAAAGAVVNRVRVYALGGYYRQVLAEYRSGARHPASRLFSPWLWR